MVCWGSNFSGRTTVPTLGVGVTWMSVTAGPGNTCGVTSTNCVICFGYADAGINVVPKHFLFASVSIGYLAACGLTIKGGAVCGGGVDAKNAGLLSVPKLSSGSKFVSVSTGMYYAACGVTDTKAVLCWGSNYDGQLTVPSGYKWSAVSVGSEHTCGLTFAGSLKCWGRNDHSQLKVPTKLPPYSTKWVQIAAGGSHTCALSDAGAITCWGENDDGECNAPASPKPTFPPPPPKKKKSPPPPIKKGF